MLELVHKQLLPSPQGVLDRITGCASETDIYNVCMMNFGVDLGCLCLGLPEVPFAQAFKKATEARVLRFATPTATWNAVRYLNFGPEKELKEAIKGVNKFAEEVIRTRKKS